MVEGIENPSDISSTEPFKAYTKYDSRTIDISDITDPISVIEFLEYDPKIKLWTFDYYPKNEAEVANYYFSLSSAEEILANSFIEIIFSENFDQLINEPLKGLTCRSEVLQISECFSL